MKEYQVPEVNLPKLRSDFAKLVKRAAKLGVAAPTLIEGEQITKAYTAQGVQVELDAPQAAHVVAYRKVSIDGEPPKLAGWTFIGTLQHVEGVGTIIRTVPGRTIPESYREAIPFCDHCKVNRLRRDTYLVANEQGVYQQVGSSCLADFLGHKSPEALARYAEYLALFDAEAESWGDASPFGLVDRNVVHLQSYLVRVAQSIREYGWVSRKAANEDAYKSATADVALSRYFHPKEGDEAQPEDVDEAANAVTWAEDNLLNADPSKLNDYLWNLRAAITPSWIEVRSIGLAASLIATARREQAKAAEKAAAQADAGPAPEGKLAARGTITWVGSSDTEYGVRYSMRLRFDNGSIGWSTIPKALLSTIPYGELVGQVVTIKATWVLNYKGEVNGRRPTLVAIEKAVAA